MTDFQRFAIYYAPEPGGLAQFGASWLGWDMEEARAMPHPDAPGLPRPVAEITQTPRKYGLHGTMKPPFRLAEGQGFDALHDEMQRFCGETEPFFLDGLELTPLGRFLALTIRGDAAPMQALAAECVRRFDHFRAPASEAELAKRRKSGLSAEQDALLQRWGYPYVMEQFRFHITLTGRLDRGETEPVLRVLEQMIAPHLPQPFAVNSLCLVGERPDGMFELIHRYTLAG